MRAALICLPSRAERALAHVAGRSVARCQVEFALQYGCDLVIAHGAGSSGEAIALRHLVEKSGARFQSVSSSHAIIGLAGDAVEMLVLQPGLWTEDDRALAALRARPCILVLGAGPGQQAGFERIDLDRAWAGGLVLPGPLVGQLDALGEDIAPAPALLRIALQHHLPSVRLETSNTDDGRWTLLRSDDDVVAQEQRWLRRMVGEQIGTAVSRRLAGLISMRWGGLLAGNARAVPLMLVGFAVLLGGGVLAAWLGWHASGLGLIALAAPVSELTLTMAKLRSAPAEMSGKWRILPWLRDGALAAAVVFGFANDWVQALFVALVLVTALALLDRARLRPAELFIADRAGSAVAIALGSTIGAGQLTAMLVASALLAANLIRRLHP